MLQKIKDLICDKKKAEDCGLSKAMKIVDKHMRPEYGRELLAFHAGYAQARIQMLFECGQITKNEVSAAEYALEDHYGKLRNQAELREVKE